MYFCSRKVGVLRVIIPSSFNDRIKIHEQTAWFLKINKTTRQRMNSDAFALSGRQMATDINTQGVALGLRCIGLSGR